jgi:hypothetical protein
MYQLNLIQQQQQQQRQIIIESIPNKTGDKPEVQSTYL